MAGIRRDCRGRVGLHYIVDALYSGCALSGIPVGISGSEALCLKVCFNPCTCW